MIAKGIRIPDDSQKASEHLIVKYEKCLMKIFHSFTCWGKETPDGLVPLHQNPQHCELNLHEFLHCTDNEYSLLEMSIQSEYPGKLTDNFMFKKKKKKPSI